MNAGFALALAQTLALKAELHESLRCAYRENDTATLKKWEGCLLPELRHGVARVEALHAEIWNVWHKPHGWEILERRYAGLASRLQTLERRLRSYLEGAIRQIEELEEDVISVENSNPYNRYYPYARVAATSVNG